jgi:hypothetical protein
VLELPRAEACAPCSTTRAVARPDGPNRATRRLSTHAQGAADIAWRTCCSTSTGSSGQTSGWRGHCRGSRSAAAPCRHRYASPEQAQVSSSTAAPDLYLALVCREATTGTPAFSSIRPLGTLAARTQFAHCARRWRCRSTGGLFHRDDLSLANAAASPTSPTRPAARCSLAGMIATIQPTRAVPPGAGPAPSTRTSEIVAAGTGGRPPAPEPEPKSQRRLAPPALRVLLVTVGLAAPRCPTRWAAVAAAAHRHETAGRGHSGPAPG